MRKTSRRRLVALIALVSLAGVVRPSPRARAQEAAQSTVTVTIDGSKDPDKIPDWILWREIFRVCALLSDNAKDHGDEIWLKHLAMRKNEEVKFVARAFVWQVDDADYDKLAKGLAGDGQNLSDNVKERLRDLFERKKAMILDHRAKLKDELGNEFYNRLLSWARLHIAPGLKVGGLSLNTAASGAPLPGPAGNR